MSELELRKYCLDQSIVILGWCTSYCPRKGLNPVDLADILYHYLTTGEKIEFVLPGTHR